MTEEPKTRRRRANGEESRRRILSSAAEVASERGYDGTTIALVSKKCGLPASSIYWHFKDKDDLIAAVIERSFATWLEAFTLAEEGSPRAQFAEMLKRLAIALLENPDFLRLGLMLALERRPEEVRARAMFLEVRDQAYAEVSAVMRQFAPDLEESSHRLLATYAISAADGLFIARELGGDSVDLIGLFELHAHLVYDAAIRLVGEERL